MALWNDQAGREKAPEQPAAKAPEKVAVLSAVSDQAPRPAVTQTRPDASMKESVISAGLIIEGKIEGAGHVRIALSADEELLSEGCRRIARFAASLSSVPAGRAGSGP
jgi:hypothetical protein